jgi:hypothetical protein
MTKLQSVVFQLSLYICIAITETSTRLRGQGRSDGTVNLPGTRPDLGGVRARSHRNEGTADLGPDLEGSHPRFSMLAGGDLIAAKVKLAGSSARCREA